MNSKDEIMQEMQETRDILIEEIAKKITFNTYSETYIYVYETIDKQRINIIDKYGQDLQFDCLKLYYDQRLNIEQIVDYIYSKQTEISWIDLSVLCSQPKETVIKVTLVHLNKTEDKLNYHCAIRLPKLIEDGKQFDVNNLFPKYFFDKNYSWLIRIYWRIYLKFKAPKHRNHLIYI